jgi:tetratricopeptide (TPR) repeat protein
MGNRRLAWSIASIGAIVPALAVAQPKYPVKAGELVKAAIAKSQAGDHVAAIELYQSAFNLVPQPMLLSNIGSEYQQANNPDEAVSYFCKYLDADPGGPNAGYATTQVKALQGQLGHQVEDKNPCKVIPPKPAPVAAPVAPAPIETAPAPEPPATAMPRPVSRADRTLEYAGLATAGVGAVLFGIGSYYGIQAKRISDSITNHDPNLPWDLHIRDQEAEGQTDNDRAIGFMVAGGVVVVAGAVVTYLGYKASSREHVAIVPVATPSAVGLAVGGGF